MWPATETLAKLFLLWRRRVRFHSGCLRRMGMMHYISCMRHTPDMAVLLVERGGCDFTQKAAMVQAAGGKAMLLYDNQTGCIGMSYSNESAVEGLQIASISISQVRRDFKARQTQQTSSKQSQKQ